jgi:hypothetical protein
VTNIGNDVGDDLTLTVDAPKRADHLLMLVGSVAGTRTFLVSVNGPAVPVTITGSSALDPLLERSVRVRLHKHGNIVRTFNTTGYTRRDLDKITLSPPG